MKKYFYFVNFYDIITLTKSLCFGEETYMKSFLKVIAVVAGIAAALVIANTIIDVMYKSTTKYFSAD